MCLGTLKPAISAIRDGSSPTTSGFMWPPTLASLPSFLVSSSSHTCAPRLTSSAMNALAIGLSRIKPCSEQHSVPLSKLWLDVIALAAAAMSALLST